MQRTPCEQLGDEEDHDGDEDDDGDEEEILEDHMSSYLEMMLFEILLSFCSSFPFTNIFECQ